MFRSQCCRLKRKLPGKLVRVWALISFTQFCWAHDVGDANGKHFKPGANITFNHNYDGATEVGEKESITLRFRSASAGNQLHIRINPDAHLQVDGPLNHRSVSGKELALTIQVSGLTPAKTYLGILAEQDNGMEKSFRVFEIPITIGHPAQMLTKPEHTATNEEGRRIIVLDSIENRIGGHKTYIPVH